MWDGMFRETAEEKRYTEIIWLSELSLTFSPQEVSQHMFESTPSGLEYVEYSYND
jgi:hypothetical protein